MDRVRSFSIPNDIFNDIYKNSVFETIETISGPIVEPKVKFFIGKNLQRNIYVSSLFRNNLWEMLQQMFSFDFCFGRTRFGRKSAMKSIFCRKNSIMTFIQLKIIRGKRKKVFLGSFFESRLTLWVQSEPKRILSS